MSIKVGDFVTWGRAKNPNALAFTGAKVLELGETADGQPAAKLDLGKYGVANALVSELEFEEPNI
jgi:hypothetical protein